MSRSRKDPLPPREKESGTLPTDDVPVRELREGDLPAVVRIDKAATGRARSEYYREKVRAALGDAKLHVSLVAEQDDHVVGFALARVFYGEFGQAEPVAMLDSIGVDPEYRGRHVASALLRQLTMNLEALRVERITTQVDWNQFDLLEFLAHTGFQPAPRLCLERRLRE